LHCTGCICFSRQEVSHIMCKEYGRWEIQLVSGENACDDEKKKPKQNKKRLIGDCSAA